MTVFPKAVVRAVRHLKENLHQEYARAYPGLDEIIRLVIDEEESRASVLSAFPHLVLPDLVEEHLTKLGLDPAGSSHARRPVPATPHAQVLAAAC